VKTTVERNLLRFHFGIIIKEKSILDQQRQAAKAYLEKICMRVFRSYDIYRNLLATKREREARMIRTLKNSKTRRILNACVGYSILKSQERGSK
jgi:hypothetical protein